MPETLTLESIIILRIAMLRALGREFATWESVRASFFQLFLNHPRSVPDREHVLSCLRLGVEENWLRELVDQVMRTWNDWQLAYELLPAVERLNSSTAVRRT